MKQVPVFFCGASNRGQDFLSRSVDEFFVIVEKFSFMIIFSLMPELNSFTCFLMYLKKASLAHLPRSMIVNTGTPVRYIAIAAPLLAEWSPIWEEVKPKTSGPSAVAALLSFFNNSVPVNRWIEPSVRRKELTIMFCENDG